MSTDILDAFGCPPGEAESFSPEKVTLADTENLSRRPSTADAATPNKDSEGDDTTTKQLTAQLKLLHLPGTDNAEDDDDTSAGSREARGCPVFSPILLETDGGKHRPVQYGLLASNTSLVQEMPPATAKAAAGDVRVFQNVAAPSSAFICGSQGSGKSHTLACMLENCLLPSEQGHLPKPLAGVVFHYDTFNSDMSGTPCEVAHLASNPDIKVRVLCSPTNIATIKRTYASIPGVSVQPLQLDEHDLNTKRMLDLMAASDGSLPLYLHVVQRILRELRVEQQKQALAWEEGSAWPRFNYAEFKRRVDGLQLQPQQSISLQQRLDTLESFMVKEQTGHAVKSVIGNNKKVPVLSKLPRKPGTNWNLQPGQLTIIDLSCPCVTQEQACSLFNICLSLSLEQRPAALDSPDTPMVGRVIALDEAHKYMGEQSAECRTLTESLLATIRLQRHLGARVLISTQEPTISSKLLDLCSVTIVHRFTSPDWLRMLSGHLAGLSVSASVAIALMDMDSEGPEAGGGSREVQSRAGIHLQSSQPNPAAELFSHIIKLKVGEALMFAPSAVVGASRAAGDEGEGGTRFRALGHEVLKIRVRKRLTADGGMSIMAV